MNNKPVQKVSFMKNATKAQSLQVIQSYDIH
jgi:hypothetical protein